MQEKKCGPQHKINATFLHHSSLENILYHTRETIGFVVTRFYQSVIAIQFKRNISYNHQQKQAKDIVSMIHSKGPRSIGVILAMSYYGMECSNINHFMFSTGEYISIAKSESCIESANHHRHNTKKMKFTIRALSRIQS